MNIKLKLFYNFLPSRHFALECLRHLQSFLPVKRFREANTLLREFNGQIRGNLRKAAKWLCGSLGNPIGNLIAPKCDGMMVDW